MYIGGRVYPNRGHFIPAHVDGAWSKILGCCCCSAALERTAPRPNWKLTDRPGFKTVFLTKKTIFDESGAVCSAEALTFQGGPA